MMSSSVIDSMTGAVVLTIGSSSESLYFGKLMFLDFDLDLDWFSFLRIDVALSSSSSSSSAIDSLVSSISIKFCVDDATESLVPAGALPSNSFMKASKASNSPSSPFIETPSVSSCLICSSSS
ncbi:hypothetical protein WICPIJ_006285 [Wickerhamomyces pijperi]|uniref:Uncharacterized protein n=1 Tax=Wickerhamomyces pijperi TaxID=599730 RepID=A0A9P8Q4A4_WICPI|nr:hypothetical protein WICPIJ_006285 [Wickerhamomyces pijperi]